VRLFFALWPPADTARALGDWAREVTKQTGGRFTDRDTIHLTLAFLGDGDPDQAIAAARPVRGSAFDLPIDTAKFWPKNKILWVGPASMPPALAAMVSNLHQSLRQHAFVLEERPFAAHITLIRKASLPKSLPPLPAVSWPATEFVLVRSTPSRTGSRYEVVERFAFQE
jgi:RNA 2',3'-cyclic 3'-phosphodiesterase